MNNIFRESNEGAKDYVFLDALQAEKINAVFPMRFRDDTDLAIATSFFQVGALFQSLQHCIAITVAEPTRVLCVQELQELGGISLAKKAPTCSWSPIPPPELRGEHVHRLTTNGGFVSFGR